MANDSLGVIKCVAMALGGMVGGGVFAVLGVVAQILHAATWSAFLLAGVVELCAGYSFNYLNRLSSERGGAVTMVNHRVPAGYSGAS